MGQTQRGPTDEQQDEQEKTVVEQRHQSPYPQMSGSANDIFRDLQKYFQLHSDGSYDFSAIRSNTTYASNNIYKTFANHGRLAHYTDDVSESMHDVVRYDEGDGIKDADKKQQRYIRGLIRDHAFVDPDDNGTVNIELVLQEDDSLTRQTVLTNLAKSTRVLVPTEDAVEQTQLHESALEDKVSTLDVEDEASFKRGWYERGQWETERR